ncbi:reticulocyte-binding protein 2 homolog a [Elysia marginata]|uniref:Reticulocyte-binding protein 2 homolog a n=1 Tax=Elysia marginata TaxID=1093978 RepID=A0AAV4IKZ7_9GAST|nr:reticulocyte-binding protein 2 homolog a [Elysia marginata]
MELSSYVLSSLSLSSDNLYGDYYPSEPVQNMSDKQGFEMDAAGTVPDQHEPYPENISHRFEDDHSQYSFQQQQYEHQQHQQSDHALEDEDIRHDDFARSDDLVQSSGDYHGNGELDDLPANFARSNQEVPQIEDEPRSFEDYSGDSAEHLVDNRGEIPYGENEAQMMQEDQQVVPGSNAFDDERPIMGIHNNPFLPQDESPERQDMPQDFGAVPQQQQDNSDEEDDTIDEVHPAEAEHGYDRLEEEPHMNDISGDIDAEDADIEMDPIDNVEFQEEQQPQEMEFPDQSRALHNEPSHELDATENDLVSGGFNPTTLEEPLQAATAGPGVESCAATVPEDDFGPDDVEERMTSEVAGAEESGVPTQMMLDDQEDDEDKENAAPQREQMLQPERMEQVESEAPGAANYEGALHEQTGMKDDDDDEEDDVSQVGLKDDNQSSTAAADFGGLDNPAFAEDDNRKLDQITEFEDVDARKVQEAHDEQITSELEKHEETQSNDEERFADDTESEPVSEQFSSQAFTSELESTPNTPGFVDNLSELASPAEVIPQPLPSPPEPRDGISPFDPLEDRDSPYDKCKENEDSEYSSEFTRDDPITSGAAERDESGFQHDDAGILPATSAGHEAAVGYPSEARTDELMGFGAGDGGAVSTSLLQDSTTAGGAADFLTGEVEGETTFGVDGTAATTLTETTAPSAEIINTGGQENAGFLNSDDEEDEEEEEEDVSQLMDQGFGEAADATTTTTTTTTEEASDELTGAGMEQEAATDNALMSMSMEGSFYDDGGDVIGGGDDQGRQHGGGAGMNHLSNSMFHPDPITEESASQPSSYDQRMDGFLSSQTDDQNFSQDLMQTSTDVADNILGDKETEQQLGTEQHAGANLLGDVPVTTAQEHSSSEAATFEGLGDDTKQQEEDAAAEEEAKLRQMEEQLRIEEEQLRQEEELRRQEEELRRQEEEKQRQEKEQRELEEQQRLQEEQLRREEEERLRQEEDERLRQEEERLRQEEERLRQEEEEERLRQEQERLAQEEERLRKEEEEQRQLEAERLKQEEEERRRQEEEAEKLRLEAERQQQQQEEEEKRRLEEEQLRQEEEIKRRLEEEQRRQEEEERQKLEEEERQRLEEEQKRLQEEEQERARQEELAKASASVDQVSGDLPPTETSAEAPAQPDDSSSVDAPIKAEEQPAAASAPETTAEAAPAAAVAAAVPAVAAAAAASPEKKMTAKSATKTSTTTPAKKSATPASKAASAKTTTSATKTTAKTTTKTTTNGRPPSATTKKTETTKTLPSSASAASKKPFDNRPITALERKAASAKPTPTTSATRPTSASKSNAPLPSYAQPITPRKPREAKVLSPEEKKKATTGRTPSATARTTRPQSATTTTTPRTTSATTKSGTSSGSTSPTKTPTTARPKSSPTKLSNGTSSDTKPFTVSTKQGLLSSLSFNALQF